MIEINSKAELDTFVAENENVFVDFYAEWCGPCKMMLPLLETISKDQPHITFCKVNVDNLAELTVQYGITSIPHMFLIKNGENVFNFKGAKPKPFILDALSKHFN